MVPAAAIAVQFETIDGLRIDLTLRVTDEQGQADTTVNRVVKAIQQYVDEQDVAAEFIEQFNQQFGGY